MEDIKMLYKEFLNKHNLGLVEPQDFIEILSDLKETMLAADRALRADGQYIDMCKEVSILADMNNNLYDLFQKVKISDTKEKIAIQENIYHNFNHIQILCILCDPNMISALGYVSSHYSNYGLDKIISDAKCKTDELEKLLNPAETTSASIEGKEGKSDYTFDDVEALGYVIVPNPGNI